MSFKLSIDKFEEELSNKSPIFLIDHSSLYFVNLKFYSYSLTSTSIALILRFPEYNDEWVTVKLEYLSKKIIAGATPKTTIEEYWVGGTVPWMSSGEVHKKKIYSTDKKITQEGYDHASTTMIPINCVLVALAGQGITRGTVAVNKIKLCTNQSIASIIPNDKLNYNYLFYYLEKNYEKLRSLSNSNGGKGSLNLNILNSLKIKLPLNIKEQYKISSFISTIDEKIDLLNDKKDEYIEFKHYLLQNLFPRNDELTPKLRFKQFIEEWKTYLLKDLGCLYRGHSYNSSNVVESGLLVLRSNNIQNNKLNFDEKELQFVNKACKKEINLKTNDIVICMSNGTKSLVGKTAQYNGEYDGDITVGAFCSIFRSENILSKYIFQIESFKRYLYILLAGTNINNIKNSDLEKFQVVLPSIKEQEEIASFLSSVDKKIDLLNQEIEQVEEYKKGLLQKMFI